jgi:hypothetical protein
MRAVTSVMRVQQILLGRLNEALEEFGLTFARYEALMLLYFSRAGSLPLGKMGDRLQVHPASVTNLVNGLERDGLVARAPHPSDRRTTLATITPHGRGTADAATQALHAIRFGTAPLGDEQLDAVTAMLRAARQGAGDFLSAVATIGVVAEPDDAVVELATRLFGMARSGDTAQLAVYVEAGVDPNLANQKGDSLLMLAAYHGHAATVRALLERGADPNRPNDRGQTPLAGAVFKGETEVIRSLLDGGADPDAGQPSAVATAQMFERADLVALLHRSA